ncbi:MAG: hypothetical protein PVH19_14995 [Planctomycetia bacterium]|jgi:hypothetical protein
MSKKPKRRIQSSVKARPVLELLQKPAYPDQAALSEQAGSSIGHWGKAAAGAATFFLAISVGGCSDSPVTSSGNQQTISCVEQPQLKPGTTMVAPIFDHGEGRGVMGCVVISPPVFLSEEEGVQIIREELSEHGIILGKGGILKGVTVNAPFSEFDKKSTDDKTSKKEPIAVDAIDLNQGVAIEFFTKEDCHQLKATYGYGSSKWTYEPKKGAERLSQEIGNQGADEVRIGIFYDPMISWYSRFVYNSDEKPKKSLTREEYEKLAEKESKEILRQQAQDFAKWLDQKGVKKDGEESS